MILSFNTNPGSLNVDTGYGYAGFHMVTAMQELGHKIPFRYNKAKVQLNFSQPQFFMFTKNQKQIGYHPWESTQLKQGWLDQLKRCDDIWATSSWVANVYKNLGIEDVYVYPHGVEKMWTPVKRNHIGGPLKFLHVGEPAPRKGGQMVFEAFLQVFGNNPDYKLTIKSHHYNTIRLYNKYSNYNYNINNISNIYNINNISIITNSVSTAQLAGIFNSHHCLIYPSYGEGFGFIPLQALASGMPTICTEEWAEYKDFLGPLALRSQYVESPWQDMHPGLVVEPSFDHLCDLLKNVANRYNTYSDFYYQQAADVSKAFDWLQLTNNAMQRIEEKFF